MLVVDHALVDHRTSGLLGEAWNKLKTKAKEAGANLVGNSLQKWATGQKVKMPNEAIVKNYKDAVATWKSVAYKIDKAQYFAQHATSDTDLLRGRLDEIERDFDAFRKTGSKSPATFVEKARDEIKDQDILKDLESSAAEAATRFEDLFSEERKNDFLQVHKMKHGEGEKEAKTQLRMRQGTTSVTMSEVEKIFKQEQRAHMVKVGEDGEGRDSFRNFNFFVQSVRFFKGADKLTEKGEIVRGPISDDAIFADIDSRQLRLMLNQYAIVRRASFPAIPEVPEEAGAGGAASSGTKAGMGDSTLENFLQRMKDIYNSILNPNPVFFSDADELRYLQAKPHRTYSDRMRIKRLLG